jgi:hypothetical protein
MRKGRHGMVEVPTGVEWVDPKDSGLGRGTRTGGSGRNRQRRTATSSSATRRRARRSNAASRTSPASRSSTTAPEAQVAEYRSRLDPDLVGLEVYYAALHWNQALVVVEKTGGYGTAMLRRIYFDFKYPRPLVYFRRSHDSSKDREEDRLGWSTDRATKPILVSAPGSRCSAKPPTRAGTWTWSAPPCWRRR